mgnify:FL=1
MIKRKTNQQLIYTGLLVIALIASVIILITTIF